MPAYQIYLGNISILHMLMQARLAVMLRKKYLLTRLFLLELQKQEN